MSLNNICLPLEKILNRHAYVRAVRAHTLLQLALAIRISKNLALADIIDLTINIKNIMNDTLSYDDIENDDGTSGALPNQFN